MNPDNERLDKAVMKPSHAGCVRSQEGMRFQEATAITIYKAEYMISHSRPTFLPCCAMSAGVLITSLFR